MWWFHLRPPEGAGPDEPELGYRLRRSAWGKGYATQGSRALIRAAFTELGARRVYAETMVVNRGSRRVMEKAGLRLVRTFHRPWPDPIEGDEHGEVEYALTRAEWEEAEAGRREASPRVLTPAELGPLGQGALLPRPPPTGAPSPRSPSPPSPGSR